MSAPIGPRIRPVITYDDDGMLTTYTGKTCSVCAVQLTSRNRYEAKLLCGEHGREHQRARIRKPKAGQTGSRPRVAAAAVVAPTDPERDRLRRLFNAWLQHPDFGAGRAVLLAAMNEYELTERLRRVLPSPAPVPIPERVQAVQAEQAGVPTFAPLPFASIPVEDPGGALTNPEHRFTLSEYLADADNYGA